MLVDSVRLRVRGGRGGRGAATFRAQPFEPRGGPDGGDGGRGGAVVLQASGSLETLQPFVRQPLLTAGAGLPGGGGRKEGRKGEDLVLEVPVGTAVFDDETEEQLADLLVAGETAVVAEGGPGGEGNLHRASSVNRSPSSAGPGLPGEERTLRLELKLPVDAALLGLPNAGKSELLAALTSARPRVGAYPHTTPSPASGAIPAGAADAPEAGPGGDAAGLASRLGVRGVRAGSGAAPGEDRPGPPGRLRQVPGRAGPLGGQPGAGGGRGGAGRHGADRHNRIRVPTGMNIASSPARCAPSSPEADRGPLTWGASPPRQRQRQDACPLADARGALARGLDTGGGPRCARPCPPSAPPGAAPGPRPGPPIMPSRCG